MIPLWQTTALRDLRAAWPEVEWGVLAAAKGEGEIVGVIDGTDVAVACLPSDLGWLRVEVSRLTTPLDDETEGMDPRDAARAVRSALKRLAAKAAGPRLVVLRGGACG